MNYTSLKANIEDVCEQTFTADQHALFAQQAEQLIYNSVEFPALRKVDTGPLTAANKLYTLPSDYLYTYSLAVISSNTTNYVLNKDVNFLREAYPINTSDHHGLPRFYAYYSDTQIMLAPTPDSAYVIEHVYGYYPTSIVTAGTTWLGDNYDTALLNGALMEAVRFQKGEADVVAMYEKRYLQAIGLLQRVGDGKLRQDMYRSGQVRVPLT